MKVLLVLAVALSSLLSDVASLPLNPDVSINSLSINIAANQQPGQQIVTTKSSYTNFWPGYRRLSVDSQEYISDLEFVSSPVPDTEVSPENLSDLDVEVVTYRVSETEDSPENLSDLEFVSSPVPDTEVSPENLSDLDVEVVTYRVSETEDGAKYLTDVRVVRDTSNLPTKSSYTNYRRLSVDSPENLSDLEFVSSPVPDTEVNPENLSDLDVEVVTYRVSETEDSPENLSDLEFVSSPVPDTEVSPENLSDLDVEVVTYRVSETEDSPENVSDVEVVSRPVSETEDISV